MLPYYIYLDSKIIGTAKQLVNFFEQGIFPKTTLVLIKKYKHRSQKEIIKIFNLYKINYQLVKNSDLDLFEKGIVLYPFNAMSNVRFVANRNLTHIFITHGESNKVSSIKPILRIYDYIVTAGDAGVDRLLSHNIVTPYDIENGKVIKMGDTFIGRTGLNSKAQNKVIFYAPTWEGGIPNENYSSLQNIFLVENYLLQACRKYNTQNIVIRPHPNTGHRLENYKKYLYNLAKNLVLKGANVTIYNRDLKISLINRFKLKRIGIKLLNSLQEFSAKVAFCDISAVETQLLNEDIPYYIFSSNENSKKYFYTKYINIYHKCFLDLFSIKNKELPYIKIEDFIFLKKYVI